MMVASLYPILVRPLRLSDLDEIMEIEPEAYGTHHWSRQSFITELTNVGASYFGAECSETGQLLGYTGYWLIADEAHVTTLAVHPQFRRKSIAERLLINSIVEARKDGAHWVTLEVRESNDPARGLYSKYGFRRLGVRRKYYQDNKEDALVLWTDRLTEPTFICRVQDNMTDLGLTEAEQKDTMLVLNGDIQAVAMASA